MASVVDLVDCAADHLADYLAPASGYAFAAYDVQGDPNQLTPVDLLAPALLDAPIRGRDVLAMQKPDGPYRVLCDALQAVLTGTGPEDRFEEQDLQAEQGAWSLVRAALTASNGTPQIKASKVTKILHRKRPALVPIFDSRVAGFYGIRVRTPSGLWPVLQAELSASRAWLTDLAGDTQTPDGRPINLLRILDIIVWTHSVVTDVP